MSVCKHLVIKLVVSLALLIHKINSLKKEKKMIVIERKTDRVMLGIQLILQPNVYKLTWHPIWI